MNVLLGEEFYVPLIHHVLLNPGPVVASSLLVFSLNLVNVPWKANVHLKNMIYVNISFHLYVVLSLTYIKTAKIAKFTDGKVWNSVDIPDFIPNIFAEVDLCLD